MIGTLCEIVISGVEVDQSCVDPELRQLAEQCQVGTDAPVAGNQDARAPSHAALSAVSEDVKSRVVLHGHDRLRALRAFVRGRVPKVCATIDHEPRYSSIADLFLPEVLFSLPTGSQKARAGWKCKCGQSNGICVQMIMHRDIHRSCYECGHYRPRVRESPILVVSDCAPITQINVNFGGVPIWIREDGGVVDTCTGGATYSLVAVAFRPKANSDEFVTVVRRRGKWYRVDLTKDGGALTPTIPSFARERRANLGTASLSQVVPRSDGSGGASDGTGGANASAAAPSKSADGKTDGKRKTIPGENEDERNYKHLRMHDDMLTYIRATNEKAKQERWTVTQWWKIACQVQGLEKVKVGTFRENAKKVRDPEHHKAHLKAKSVTNAKKAAEAPPLAAAAPAIV